MGGPQAAGGTPARPGGSTLPVPATKNHYQYMFLSFTDKKEKQIFLICKGIQNGAVAKSYTVLITTFSSYTGKYLRISSYIRKPFLIYMNLQLLHSKFH
jgi:hypothetical protein